MLGGGGDENHHIGVATTRKSPPRVPSAFVLEQIANSKAAS